MEIEKQGFSITIQKENNNEPELTFMNRCKFIINIYITKKIDYYKLIQLSYIWSNIYHLNVKYSKQIMSKINELTKNTEFSIN